MKKNFLTEENRRQRKLKTSLVCFAVGRIHPSWEHPLLLSISALKKAQFPELSARRGLLIEILKSGEGH